MSFKKRLTAALILVAIIISCLPVTANAAGTTYKEIKDLTIQYRVTGESSYKNYAASARFSGMDGLIIRSKNKPYFLSYKCRDASHGWLDSIYSINSTKDDFAGWPGYSVTNYAISILGPSLGTYDGPVILYRAYVAGEWLDWVSNAPSAAKTVMSSFGISGTLDTAATDAGWSTRGVITGIEIRLFEPVVNYPKPSKTAKIITAPYIFQYYDYPNGCESVSAVMALQYCGYNISVATFIDKYLPRGSTPTVGGTGPDPDQVYCGDPRSFSGWGCFAPVIKTAVSKYVNKNDYTAACVEGKSMEELCRLYIDNGIPVITWVTVDMKMMSSSTVYATWTTSAGKTVKYPRNLHCMLLVGYDENNYYFNDPAHISENGYVCTGYSKSSVNEAYNFMGKRTVVISPVIHTYSVDVNLTSFGDETEPVLAEIYAKGSDTPVYSTTLTGNSVSFKADGLLAGSYVLRARKDGNSDLQYPFTVNGNCTISAAMEEIPTYSVTVDLTSFGDETAPVLAEIYAENSDIPAWSETLFGNNVTFTADGLLAGSYVLRAQKDGNFDLEHPFTVSENCTVIAVMEKIPAYSVTVDLTSVGNGTETLLAEIYAEGSDTPVWTDTLAGNNVSFTADGLLAGSYVLRASKEYNYDLEYTFTVSEDCTFTVAMESVPILKGDINFDGKVNPIDANLMVRIVLGTDETDYRSFSAADVNCDGKVNSLDANLILQMVLGG